MKCVIIAEGDTHPYNTLALPFDSAIAAAKRLVREQHRRFSVYKLTEIATYAPDSCELCGGRTVIEEPAQ